MQAVIQIVLFFTSVMFLVLGLGAKGAGEVNGNPTEVAIGYAAFGIGLTFALPGIFGPTKDRRVRVS